MKLLPCTLIKKPNKNLCHAEFRSLLVLSCCYGHSLNINTKVKIQEKKQTRGMGLQLWLYVLSVPFDEMKKHITHGVSSVFFSKSSAKNSYVGKHLRHFSHPVISFQTRFWREFLQRQLSHSKGMCGNGQCREALFKI